MPRWESKPPAWLTTKNWSPLALHDYGDSPAYTNLKNPFCWATANLSFRREVFERVGLFSPDFPRAQDLELILRLWRAGGQGLYVPNVLVTAEIQPERLTKQYHRRWHTVDGEFHSLLRLRERVGKDGKTVVDETPARLTLFGVPAFIYRDLIEECKCWLKSALAGDESLSFMHENQVRHLIGYIRKRYERSSQERNHSHLAEVGSFAKTISYRKVSQIFRKSLATLSAMTDRLHSQRQLSPLRKRRV